MNSCHCRNNTCPPETPVSCPDSAQTGEAILIADDNCCEKRLQGEGVAYRESGTVAHTDGSDRNGRIKLNPPNSNGIEELFGKLQDGTLVAIGKDSSEGSVLIRRAGFWTASQLTEASRIFKANSIRQGSGMLAAFICSTEGNVEIGIFDKCNSAFIYLDDEGVPQCKTITNVATDLVTALCAVIPVLASDETAEHTIVCSENGLRKQGGTVTNTWLNPPVLLYSQVKAASGTPLFGNEIINIPPLPNPTVGYIVDETVNVNLTAVSGYDVKAKYIRLNLWAKGYGGTSSHDLVIAVDGMEYLRVPLVNDQTSGSDSNQIQIPIPSNKTIQIQGIRQVNFGSGSGDELGYLAVWLQEWIF